MRYVFVASAALVFVLAPHTAHAPPSPDDEPPNLDTPSDGGLPENDGSLVYNDPNCAQYLDDGSGRIRVHSETSACEHHLVSTNVGLYLKPRGILETGSYDGVHLFGELLTVWVEPRTTYVLSDPYGLEIKPVSEEDSGDLCIQVSAVTTVDSSGKTVVSARDNNLQITDLAGNTVYISAGDVAAFLRGYHYYSRKSGQERFYDLPAEAYGQDGCTCRSGSSEPLVFVFFILLGLWFSGSRRQRR